MNNNTSSPKFPKSPQVIRPWIFSEYDQESIASISDSRSESTISIYPQIMSNTISWRHNKITESFENWLGSKLIINKGSNWLIFKPYIIYEIWNYMRTGTSTVTKLEIIEKLSWIISRWHINSYILTNKSIWKEIKNNATFSFISEFIELLLLNTTDQKFTEISLKFLSKLIYFSGINERYFTLWLRKMTVFFKDDSLYDSNKFLLILKIIKTFFTKSIHDGKQFPEKFFYFNNNSSQIKVDTDELQYKNISLAKGYTVGMWIYLEKISTDASNKNITTMSSLFIITTNKDVTFELNLKNNSLFYLITNNSAESTSNSYDSENPPVPWYLCDIEYAKWTFLTFSHKAVSFLQKPSIVLYINNANNPIIKQLDYPNLNNQKIISVTLLKDFTGLLSNIFMLNETFTQGSIVNNLSKYSFGWYNERNICIFRNYINNDILGNKGNNDKSVSDLITFFDNMIFMYSPCRVKENICKDWLNNLNAEINNYYDRNNIGGVFSINNTTATNVYEIESINIFLPIFDFIFNSKFGTPIVLEEALNILLTIFRQQDYYYIQTKNKDNTNHHFFELWACIIEGYDISRNWKVNLFTIDILNLWLNIGRVLIQNESTLSNKENTKHFFRNIIWNPSIFTKFDMNIQIYLWSQIKEMYTTNLIVMNTIANAPDFLNIIVKVYDTNTNMYCCLTHYKMLSENTINSEDIAVDQTQSFISSPELWMKITDLLFIVKEIWTSSKIISITQLKSVVLYWVYKISPCWLKNIIMIIKEIFCIDDNSQKWDNKIIQKTRDEYINSFILNKGIDYWFYISSLTTLDVRLECLKIFHLLSLNEAWSRYMNYDIYKEYIPYLAYNIFPWSKLKRDTVIYSELNPEWIKSSSTGSKGQDVNWEDNYLMTLWNSDLIGRWNLPISYIDWYSNPVNNMYLEKIYNYLLQWWMDKFDIDNVDNSPQLDDESDIINEHVLNIILQVIQYANIMLKFRFLSDWYTWTQFNRKNSFILLQNKYFYQWWLDTLLPYHIIKTRVISNNANWGWTESINDIGFKLHSIIITNTLFFLETSERGWLWTKSFYGTWTTEKIETVDLKKVFHELMGWLYKVRERGIRENKVAMDWVKWLLSTILEKINNVVKKLTTCDRAYILETYLFMITQVYEFVIMINFDKKLINSTSFGNFDWIEKNEIFGEIIQNLNYDYSASEDSLAENNKIISWTHGIVGSCRSSNQTQIINLWEDKDLLIKVYDSFKEMWDDSFFVIDNNNKTNCWNKDEKLQDNLQLWFNWKSVDEKQNKYVKELNILVFSDKSILKDQGCQPINIMNCLLNTIMLIIRWSETQENISYWIKELEKYVVFLLVSSDNLGLDKTNPEFNINETYLLEVQDEISKVFILTINFWLDEINSPRRDEFNSIIKEFTHCWRILFISFTLIIKKILEHIENEASQSTLNSVYSIFSSIKNALYLQSQPSYLYSPLWKVYNHLCLTKDQNKLFNYKDIKEFILNKYIEIPNKFRIADWTYAFQDNANVNKILKNHFHLQYYEHVLLSRRKKGESVVLNRDICSKQWGDINKVNKKIFDSVKNCWERLENNFWMESYEMLYNQKRCKYALYSLKKRYFTWQGKWNCLDDYWVEISNNKVKFKIGNHFTHSYYSPILFPIYDVKTYLPLFKKYNTRNMFLNSEEDKADLLSNSNETKNQEIPSITVFPPEGSDNINNEDQARYIGTDSNNNNNNFNSNVVTNDHAVTFYYNNNNNNSNFNSLKYLYTSIDAILKYFNHSFKYSLNYQCILSIEDFYILSILKGNSILGTTSKLYKNVCVLKLNCHTPGSLLFTFREIHFISKCPMIQTDNTNGNNTKCNGSLFDYDYRKPRKISHIIPLNSIKQIFKRRYFYKKTGLEIFTTNNNSYFYIFNTQIERDELAKFIIDTTSSLYKINVDSSLDTLQKTIREWEQWNYGTWDLLMLLNIYSGRSFKDLTQYPVFPWVIQDYSSSKIDKFDETTIRNLAKPIGALGRPSRIEEFKSKFEEHESDIDVLTGGKYFYSSHYSNPFYVVHYLYRLFPYASSAIELQGSNFDQPERQFFSIKNSFMNCMSESADVRECIPEFFYWPEMFDNINKINFNSKDISEKPCELPPWCRQNQYYFIYINIIAIESNYVSKHINNWIDLIFGYKQKGKDAIEAMNLFFPFTYENEIDIDKYQKENQDEYDSYISKIEFGQTPSQWFQSKPFPQRMERTKTANSKIIFEVFNQLRNYNSTSEQINSSKHRARRRDISNKMIIYIKAIKSNKVLCVFNNGIGMLWKADDLPYSESGLIFIKEKQFNLPTDYKESNHLSAWSLLHTNDSECHFTDEDDEIMKNIENTQPVLSLENGKYIIKGGYYDAKFLLWYSEQNNTNNKYIFIRLDEENQVTSLLTDNQREEYLFVGTSMGRIYIYNINKESKDIESLWTLKTTIQDHTGQIISMFICTKLNIFNSISWDKTCNVYVYPRMKIIRAIKGINEGTCFDYVFVSNSPLPSIILYSKNEMLFYVYSINGVFLKKVRNTHKVLYSPRVVSDNFNRDFLVYGTQNGSIIFKELPYCKNNKEIEQQMSSENTLSFPIKCWDFSEDKQNLYYWQWENFNWSVIKSQKDLCERAEKTIKMFDSKELNI